MRIYKHRKTVLSVLLLAAAVVTACNKSDSLPPAPKPPGYYGRQAFILPINSNFILYDTSMKLTGLLDTLTLAGPYTTFIPDNNAFNAMHWGAVGAGGLVGILQLPSDARTILLSMIFPGTHYLDSMPAGTNQVWTSLAGNHAYISKYISPDTAYTINGVPVYTADFPSTNGPIQVLDSKRPVIETYPTVLNYVDATPELSYLAVALRRTGLDKVLDDPSKNWTLLAPVNDAFQNSADASLKTLDGLLAADTAKLAGMLRLHMVEGRSFLFDFDRLTHGGADTAWLPSLYAGEPVGFLSNNTFFAKGSGAIGLYPLSNPPVADEPVGNGVIHELTGFLLP